MRNLRKKRQKILNRFPIWSAKIAHLFLFAFVLSVFFFMLIMTNNLSTKGSEIRLLEEQRNKLEYEINLLINEKDRLASLSRIKEEAKNKLGMVEDTKSFEYLSKEDFAYGR